MGKGWIVKWKYFYKNVKLNYRKHFHKWVRSNCFRQLKSQIIKEKADSFNSTKKKDKMCTQIEGWGKYVTQQI